MINVFFQNLIRPPDVSREGLKFYPRTFFLFYQSTVLSSHAVDGHQMYFGGSVVHKASTIGREISPTPPLFFTGVKKWKFGVIQKHHSTLSCPRLKMQQDIRILKQKCNAAMIALCPDQVW